MLLFTGKGGVGKTTTAAATAVAAARAGLETLVLSTDAAHSLSDTLDLPLTAQAQHVAPRLQALQVSSAVHFADSWQVVHAYLGEVLGAIGIDPVVAGELTSLPGAEEIAALLEVRDHVASGDFDLVVVDCAPTAETLRLLALPETLAWHLRRVLPGSAGLRRAARPAAAAALGVPLPSEQIIEIVRGWADDMAQVHDILSGPYASVRLVTTPESVVVAEARRTWTSVSLFGFAVDAVHVNKVLPAPAQPGSDPASAWLQSWNLAQEKGLGEVSESFAGIPVVISPYLDREPIGAAALLELAAHCVAGDDPMDLLRPVDVPGMEVTATDGGFDLLLTLPLASAREVDLKRRDDDLLIAVGDHRRIITLPSVLRRCDVTGAAVRAGRLRVSFVPDPAQWPRR